MKINRFLRLAVACLLSLSSLLIVAAPQAHATPINCIWAGSGSGNTNFSDSGNWQNCNGGAPTGNGTEELVFPVTSGVVPTVNDNLNLSGGGPTGGSFTDIRFTTDGTSSQGYNITGDPITVGNITDQSTTSTGNKLALNISLSGTGAVTFTGSSSSQLIIGDPNNIGSNSLGLTNSTLGLTDVTVASAITGNTAISVTGGNNGVSLLASSPSFTGSITAAGNTLSLDNANSSATLEVTSSSTLKGDGGSAHSITVDTGGIIAPGHSPGCLTASSQLVINGTYQAEIAGTTPCSSYDQITSASSTDLSNGTLNVSFLSGFTPAVGNTFTIIKNTGGGTITGTFAGLPEGGTLQVGNITFAITYQGNGENDVVLTVTSVSPAVANAMAPGAPNTGLAAITAHPLTVLVCTTLAAFMLLLVSRRLKSAQQ